MFSYCGNNPVTNVDHQGTAYRPVGAGLQFELDVGSGIVGVEVICYWDVDECANGGATIAVYTYCGFSLDTSDALLASILATITDNSNLLAGGCETGIVALAALIGDTFSLSVSGVLITGTEDFNATESYTGSFTSVGGSWGKVTGSYAYSENCKAYSLGGNVAGGSLLPSWNISKTYYQQIVEFSIGTAQTNSLSCAGGRGGAICRSSMNAHISYALLY